MRIITILRKSKNKIRFKHLFFLILYKILLKHLPKSTNLFFGKYSKYLRYQCCKRIFKYCGKNVNIERGADFGSGFDLMISDNSGIGVNCKVPSNIKIGSHVMMGPECYILDTNHSFERTDIPMTEQGHADKQQTIIEDDVWIGREVLILPGRKIRRGTIIGARCVVTKDFQEYSIIGGNPSKLIRSRKINQE